MEPPQFKGPPSLCWVGEADLMFSFLPRSITASMTLLSPKPEARAVSEPPLWLMGGLGHLGRAKGSWDILGCLGGIRQRMGGLGYIGGVSTVLGLMPSTPPPRAPVQL